MKLKVTKASLFNFFTVFWVTFIVLLVSAYVYFAERNAVVGVSCLVSLACICSIMYTRGRIREHRELEDSYDDVTFMYEQSYKLVQSALLERKTSSKILDEAKKLLNKAEEIAKNHV
jgi:hypothetical protein